MHAKPPHISTIFSNSATPRPGPAINLSNNMAGITPKTILLVLSVAFTVTTTAVAQPSNETLLLNRCTEALGPGHSNLVTFCAHDFLAHRAALLASCDRRKTVAVVIKEAYNRAKAIEDLGKKIDSDKSLSGTELQDLKTCWGFMNKITNSVMKFFSDAALKMPSSDPSAEFKGMFDQVRGKKGQCNFFAAGRQKGVWLELQVKVKECLRAELVMLAFVNQLYNH